MRVFPLVALLACKAPVVPNGTAPPATPVEGCPSNGVSLDVGDCAPDFELLNADGTPIRLADKVGERLVVVGASVW